MWVLKYVQKIRYIFFTLDQFFKTILDIFLVPSTSLCFIYTREIEIFQILTHLRIQFQQLQLIIWIRLLRLPHNYTNKLHHDFVKNHEELHHQFPLLAHLTREQSKCQTENDHTWNRHTVYFLIHHLYNFYLCFDNAFSSVCVHTTWASELYSKRKLIFFLEAVPVWNTLSVSNLSTKETAFRLR